MGTMTFDDFTDLENRELEEEKDALDTVVPPADIVAFTEQRSCADLYRMCQKGQIDLYPDFQRGEVWKNRAQTLFVDSMIKQLPIPSMCISLDVHSQKRYVIDGLQRITTICKFLGDNDWKLSKIDDVDERISGKKKVEIEQNSPDIIDIVENLAIPVTVIRCDYSKASHMQYLFQIFYRLNSGGNKLYNQEIRNCIFQGNFNTLLKDLARSPDWLNANHLTQEKVETSRFNNEERILRFFAFYYDIDRYKGKLASFLNDFMRSHKDLTENVKNEYASLLSRSLKVAMEIEELSTSKNVFEAVLIGIAANISALETKGADVINKLYKDVEGDKNFSEEALKEGLGSLEKVQNRINAAKIIFARG